MCPRSFLRCLCSESCCEFAVLRGALGGVCVINLVLSGVWCVPSLLWVKSELCVVGCGCAVVVPLGESVVNCVFVCL